MSNKAPAFQLFAGDFLSDTLTWTAQELGVHIRLMCWSWDNGPLPTDPKRIDRIDRDASKCWATVGPKWQPDGNGGLVNNRLEKTRAELIAYRERQKERGKRSAEARSGGNQRSTNVQPTFQPDTQPKGNNKEGVGVGVGSSISRKERAPAPDGFDAFWRVYPVHKAKANAVAAWAKLKPEEAAKCLPAIEAQVKANHFRGSDGVDYVPHGATWLNGHRWEDEVKSFPVITTNGKPLTKEQGYALMNEIRKNNGLHPDDPVPQHLMTRELIELFNR